jgi:anti-anti-sigma factor
LGAAVNLADFMPYEGDSWRAPSMRVEAQQIDDATTLLAVHGELDVATVDTLVEALGAQAAGDSRRVVVDLAGVSFLDSTAMAALAEGRDRIVAAGGSFALVTPDDHQRRLFHLTELIERLRVSRTREEALAALDPTGDALGDRRS